MKILLTGGTGQVGTEVRRRLGDLDLLAPDRSAMDLARPETVRATLDRIKPDLVLSVGAYTAVDRAEDEPDIAMAVNGAAVQALADYCRANGAPLIHISTDYVFSGDKLTPYDPADPTDPLGVYGVSKLAGEFAARSVDRHLIIRVSWVFSAHGGNFVKTMLRVGAMGKPLRVVDDQRGGPTWAGHIAELLEGLVRTVQSSGTLPWGTYHFSGAPDVSWFEFASRIFTEARDMGILQSLPDVEPIPSSAYATKARRPQNSCFVTVAAERAFDVERPVWQLGLRATLAELKGP